MCAMAEGCQHDTTQGATDDLTPSFFKPPSASVEIFSMPTAQGNRYSPVVCRRRSANVNDRREMVRLTSLPSIQSVCFTLLLVVPMTSTQRPRRGRVKLGLRPPAVVSWPTQAHVRTCPDSPPNQEKEGRREAARQSTASRRRSTNSSQVIVVPKPIAGVRILPNTITIMSTPMVAGGTGTFFGQRVCAVIWKSPVLMTRALNKLEAQPSCLNRPELLDEQPSELRACAVGHPIGLNRINRVGTVGVNPDCVKYVGRCCRKSHQREYEIHRPGHRRDFCCQRVYAPSKCLRRAVPTISHWRLRDIANASPLLSDWVLDRRVGPKFQDLRLIPKCPCIDRFLLRRLPRTQVSWTNPACHCLLLAVLRDCQDYR